MPIWDGSPTIYRYYSNTGNCACRLARQNGQVQRLHQLDFCQLAGVLPDQKYAKDGGSGLADIFSMIDRYAAVPGRDRLQVLDWVVFNYLIGNADAHAKNLAMLVGAGNRLQLAPLYDLLCTSVYPQLDTRMAMAIGGEYRPEWVQQRHWQRFAAVCSGLQPRLASTFRCCKNVDWRWVNGCWRE